MTSVNATSARPIPGCSALCSPAAATISGDGVSPAASAAASGSPPGSAADTASADAGRCAGSRSRQRRIARSIAGSRSRTTDDGVATVPVSCSCDQLVERLRLEGARAGEELEEHEAERVDVAARRDLACRRAARAPCRPACRRGCRRRSPADGREAEVGDADVARRRRSSRWPASDRGAARRARARRRGRRRSAARSRSPCPAGSGRCGAAATPDPRRRRTPSSGTAAVGVADVVDCGRRCGARPVRATRTSLWNCASRAGVARRRRRAGTSARPAGRASDRRRGRPRPCRRARAARRCGSGRRRRCRARSAPSRRRSTS